MITVDDIEEMKFGLIKGKRYRIISRTNNGKIKFSTEGIYLGEGGHRKSYLMFKLLSNNTIECFLKIDIVIGEYQIVEMTQKGVIANG